MLGAGECQWQHAPEMQNIDDLTRDEGFAACSALWKGLKVSDLMDLETNHGYTHAMLSSLKPLTRAQGTLLMERVRDRRGVVRNHAQVSISSILACCILCFLLFYVCLPYNCACCD